MSQVTGHIARHYACNRQAPCPGLTPRSRLHFDADTSSKSLLKALTEMGHDPTRIPNQWMTLNATGLEQLTGDAAQGTDYKTDHAVSVHVSSKIPHAQVFRLPENQPPDGLNGEQKVCENT